ncbi:nonsense-mediated mRNA decay factor SMG8 isoform X1 [Schistocerca piceifrons]|uniref:nonsense-mediated mRNA decay factor SMG8 isoform X1 n=1 Tax=Schistocerca piceifrons TaxID=274613 RepID=UPI001F5FCF92|nr:nonsense-mediated mRNA decay factor SMG8 isoform X1 [Schistocerca piceifrons]
MGTAKFYLPYTPPEEQILLNDKKVAVVSFFGKSPISARGCKAGLIDEILGKQIFHKSLLEDPDVDKNNLCDIEGYYDTNQRVVYLHLRGVFDVHSLVKMYDTFSRDMEQKGYLSVWAELKYHYARALLFLFAVSHILVVYHPTHAFDISYVHLFRALDVVRQKMQGTVSEILRSVTGVPKEWINNARPCSPRVLFLFNSCPSIFKVDGTAGAGMGPSAGAGEQSKSAKLSIKKLEHALEDQIYHILRKSRVITNVSTNSLFAIPANQEFVYVRTKPDPTKDFMSHMIKSLINFCQNPVSVDRLSEGMKNVTVSKQDEAAGSRHSFKSFLHQHIDLALGKGFDDNVGKHALPSYFEVATASVWFELANKLIALFLPGSDAVPDKSSRQQVFTTLRTMLDTDVRFSEGRCGKVLPLAIAAYQENLPPHYTRDYHEERLGHALSLFMAQARGPLVEEYTTQLERECERHWRSGRQMCEVLSLTGHPCTNPLHRGGGEGAGGGELNTEAADSEVTDTRDPSQLPLMEHSSGVRYVSACNCGRKQGPREDPFTVRTANYDFYRLLGEECGCNKLESFRFPVFQPSTQNYRAAQLFSNGANSKRKDSSAKCVEGKELTVNTPQGNTQVFSLAGFVSGQSAGSDLIQEEIVSSRLSPHPNPPREQSPSDGHEIVIQVSDADNDPNKDKSLVRQPSTTEYLPGMLHTESPAGLLPQFPSWALTCLGPSSLYSHNLGLQDQQQAGLLGGSAYLLPWDVTVRLEHHRDRNSGWPAVGDSYRGKHPCSSPHMSSNLLRGRKSKGGNKDLSEFVVKIFVGVEYECPRGHRFMCAAPDKVLKTTGSGLVKDNGNKVTGSDMPLYFPCPCRTTKPLVAQLMRVHVVTPKAPVHVTLNPRVQPAPPPCPIFVTGCDQPLRLSQSAYWVLRLPYVYVGDQGPYLAPKEPVPLNYGRLLTDVYGITEVTPEEK